MNLITGATGFIGRYLAQRLIAQNEPVRVLCRESSIGKLAPEIRSHAQIALGDLRDARSVADAVDQSMRVFHCAGHVSDWGSESDFTSINVDGTRLLLDAALEQKNFQRFVHLSSIAVFGVPAPKHFDDTSPYGNGADLYSRTKIEGEKLALAYHREKRLPVTVLRPSVVYGRHSTWLEEPLKMIRQNKMFLLGRGRGTCHPCYIENLIDAMLLVGFDARAIGNAYIVSDGESVSFEEYFNEVARIGRKGPIKRSIPLWAARFLATGCETTARVLKTQTRPLLTHTAIDMVCTPSQMSIDKIKRELGFSPRYSFESAIQDIFVNYPFADSIQNAL